MTAWVNSTRISGAGKRALTVGCGLGDDAEFLAKTGFTVTAFDISPKAIDWCRLRFPGSKVQYTTTNLFNAPQNWNNAFDFVFEAYTLQALPGDLRRKAIPRIAGFVNLGGTLLVITRARDDQDDLGELPWPLTRQEVDVFQECYLAETSFQDYTDDLSPPIRRFRLEYRRAKKPTE